MTVAVVLLKTKTNQHFVNLRLTEGRKSRYLSIGHKVEPAMFKEDALNNWVHGRHPDAMLINALIEAKRTAAMQLIVAAQMKQQAIDLDYIIEALKGKVTTGQSFLQAITDRAKFHYANNSPGSYYKYNNLRKQVEKAWKRDYSPDQITAKEIEIFRLYRKKTVVDNTIRKDISFLATTFRNISNLPNPFEDVKIVPVPTRKEKLTPDEIFRIEKLVLFGMADIARDMFLFSFYAQGMRFENVCMMPRNCLSAGLITYQMNKGKKHRQLQSHKRLAEIIEKYQSGSGPFLFPVLKGTPEDVWKKRDMVGSANSDINKFLKAVGAASGLNKKLTFHMARHTMANQALGKGVTYSQLKDILGHSNFSTTQGYLDSLNDDGLNNAMSKLYGE